MAGPEPHRVSAAEFDLLARAAGGVPLMRKLRDAERSRRLLLLLGLVRELDKNPELLGPLPPVANAWELLMRVDRKTTRIADSVVSHPYTGSWLGQVTRMHHHDPAEARRRWPEFGHLHALSAAAGLRAGLDFELAVPVRWGSVHLPTLGAARFPEAPDFAVAEVRARRGRASIRCGASEVVLPEEFSHDGPRWWGLRRVPLHNGASVVLDDLDPYRGLAEPVPSARLDENEFAQWCRLLPLAWRKLDDRLPELAPSVHELLVSIVPGRFVPFRHDSASTGEAFGSAIVGLGESADTLASVLVHEFQHIVLGGLLHLVPLREEDQSERCYAPWRTDPRPVSGMLQGVYAFFGVTACFRGLARGEPVNRLAAFEFALWGEATARAARSIRADSVLTAAGKRFLAGVLDTLEPWLTEPIDQQVRRWAELQRADHYAGWRIRHLRADPRTVTELARAWLAGLDRPESLQLPEPSMPTPVPDGPWSQARHDLRRLLLGQGGYEKFARNWHLVPLATEADRAFVEGRAADAVAGYREQLRAAPDLPSAWIGLGLALSLSGTSSAARALMHRPELVRAVHRELRRAGTTAPSPDRLAQWIGRFTH